MDGPVVRHGVKSAGAVPSSSQHVRTQVKGPSPNTASRANRSARPSLKTPPSTSPASSVLRSQHNKGWNKATPASAKPRTIQGVNSAASKAKRLEKPSNSLNPKTIDPFNTTATRTQFESAYENGSVPCRLIHGSVRHKLQWETSPENLHFDPLLVTLAEGLRETRHPFTFIAKEGFKELLMTEDAEEKTIPLVSRLMGPIKMALTSSNGDVFERGLEAIVQVSNVVGTILNGHLKTILPQLARKLMDKKFKEKVISALQQLEYNGGKESLALIKARVPTYQSIYG